MAANGIVSRAVGMVFCHGDKLLLGEGTFSQQRLDPIQSNLGILPHLGLSALRLLKVFLGGLLISGCFLRKGTL